MLSPLLDAPLIDGLLPATISVLGLVGGLILIAGRSRRWWTRQVPRALVAGIAVAAVAGVVVVGFRPFPDPLPVRMLFWIAVPAAAVVLAWAQRDRGRGHRVLAALAVLAVLATALVKANAFYGYRPTLAAVLDLPTANQIELDQVPRVELLMTAPPTQPLARTWHSPPGMPRTGRISSVTVPGRHSHFPARPAWLYLPPAYLGSTRARLPVLVLVPGQPGGPIDWILAGRLAAVMDAFAAAHDGLAPIVIVPDATGSNLGNTLCLDSRLGAAETYLTQDVPEWLAATLQIDAAHFAIGGFSFGGTCALQLAVRRPDVYPTFLDIAGQAEPTLGGREHTVRAAFGGDHDAFRRVNPLDELRTARFPASAGIVTVGRNDSDFHHQAEQVVDAARGSGMSITLQELPGGHSWAIASAALAGDLPWISGRLGLLEPTAAPP